MSGKKKAFYEIVLESKCPKTAIQCKGCQKEFLSTTILKHLGHKPSCTNSYDQAELDSMKEKAKLRKWANIKSWLNKNDQSLENAKRYKKRKKSQKHIQKSGCDDEPSEYEKIRLANIEQNKILLEKFKSTNNM